MVQICASAATSEPRPASGSVSNWTTNSCAPSAKTANASTARCSRMRRDISACLDEQPVPICDESMIKSAALRDWWQQGFRGRDREGMPFCDPAYSSVMPAADFTICLREFLIRGDFESIRELLWLVSEGFDAWGIQIDWMLEAAREGIYSDDNDGRVKAEADAVVMLVMRMAFHTLRPETFILESMGKLSVGAWKPGAHAGCLREMPPTFRSIVHDPCGTRKNGALRVRPQRDYGERCFGNNKDWNEWFMVESGFFKTEDGGKNWKWKDADAEARAEVIRREMDTAWRNGTREWFLGRFRRMVRRGGQADFQLSPTPTNQVAAFFVGFCEAAREERDAREKIKMREHEMKRAAEWTALPEREKLIRRKALINAFGIVLDHDISTSEGVTELRSILDGRKAAIEERMRERLKQAIARRQEEYERRNSPEALLAMEVERRRWYDLLDFSAVACKKVKSAILSDHEQLGSLDMQLREALKHERLKEKPRAAAALNRALGHLEEFRNHWDDAVAFYAAALDLNPDAGCKKDLEALRKRA